MMTRMQAITAGLAHLLPGRVPDENQQKEDASDHLPPESIMETCSVVETVDKILWCDHFNETSSAVPLHGTICFSIFYKIKFVILYDYLPLG